ncbi:MAG: hypothetical protein RL367_1106, partial [Pseudomonadota bacterium]
FHIGFGPELDHRVADLIPPDGALGEWISEVQRKSLSNPEVNPLDTRTRSWRAAEIPAAGGHGNARSVAEIHMLLANGGVAKGKRLLSEAGCRKALELQVEGPDKVLMNFPVRFGLGFGLPGEMIPLPNPNTIYWGGYGGSLIVIDMDARATYSYVMNKMNSGLMGDTRSFGLIAAMWGAMASG